MAPAAPRLIEAIVELAQREPWRDEVRDRDGAILAAAAGDVERPSAVAALRPAKPSEAAAAAQGLSEAELLVARAMGADWLDAYVAVDRHRRLQISGQDLVDAGIEPGPAIGRGLDEAVRAMLDGEAASREDQLRDRAASGSPNCPLMEWREQDGVRWLHAGLPRALAAFSTRLGGRSAGPFESLNLGLRTGDERAAVLTNRARLAAAIDRDPDGMLLGRQVHEAEVLVRERAPEPNPYVGGQPAPAADGQATATPRLTPLVQVADCLPVALAGERGVAMLHCGWRGLAAGIVARGVEAVGATAAAIGPGIGRCCYEVDEPVLSRFADLGDGIATGRMLDLEAVATRLLERAGVVEIEAAGLCTSCEPERSSPTAATVGAPDARAASSGSPMPEAVS